MKARNRSPATRALGLNRRDSAVATVVLPAPGGPVTAMRSGTSTIMPTQPPRSTHVLTDSLTGPSETGKTRRTPGDGFELAALVGGTYRPSGDLQDARRFAHNPEVAGSNPAPATRSQAPSDHGGAFRMPFVNEFVNEALLRRPAHAAGSLLLSTITPRSSALASPVSRTAPVMPTEASKPPRISSASVFATWRSASRSVWTYCFIVNATSEWPMRLLSAFQSIFASRPAVA